MSFSGDSASSIFLQIAMAAFTLNAMDRVLPKQGPFHALGLAIGLGHRAGF